MSVMPANDIILEGVDLTKHFGGGGLLASPTIVRAVDGVSLGIRRGETFAVVGESGCGKSTLGRLLLRLIEPTGGDVRYEGHSILKLSKSDLRKLRRELQIIFQDPYASLNPRMNVGDIIAEPIWLHNLASGREKRERVADLMRTVGLLPTHSDRYPHEFSGGQRQRIGIARALALDPSLVVADEPVSALDVSVQAQIINLLLDLQDRLKLSMLFVAHDLGVVRHVSDRVAVMYLGRIVETASTTALYATPRHPYTEALLAAVPKADPALRDQTNAPAGEIADPANPPSGCAFHPRCPYAVDRCRTELPALREIAPAHWSACHRSAELSLRGVA